MTEDKDEEWLKLKKKLDDHFTTNSNDISVNDMMKIFGLGVEHFVKEGSDYKKKEPENNNNENSVT